MEMQPLPVERLSMDLRRAARTLSEEEARFLVDSYYARQDDRIRAKNQVRASGESGEPHTVITALADQSDTIEQNIKLALDQYSASHDLGIWARSIVGIGPVIAAGLLAHIDISKAPTVGHIWRFAGLDPSVSWNKGQKRPWNAKLKVLCWKAGESFKKFSGRDDCFYGKIYRERKAYEVERNVSGGNAETAAATLEKKKFSDKKTKEIYEAGRLPDGRIDLRATRYAVKLFLAHYHEVGYEQLHGTPPPLPYPIAHLSHAHKIERPN